MGDDYSRVFNSQPTSQRRSVAVARPSAKSAPRTAPSALAKPIDVAPEPVASGPAPLTKAPAVSLAGKSESELRALLGSPSSEEDRPPGKVWRYRDGRCSLDVQLYPDVRTKQFGTLAYEVSSDDNTDEGKRLCLAEFQSRVQAGR